MAVCEHETSWEVTSRARSSMVVIFFGLPLLTASTIPENWAFCPELVRIYFGNYTLFIYSYIFFVVGGICINDNFSLSDILPNAKIYEKNRAWNLYLRQSALTLGLGTVTFQVSKVNPSSPLNTQRPLQITVLTLKYFYKLRSQHSKTIRNRYLNSQKPLEMTVSTQKIPINRCLDTKRFV